MPSIKEQVQNHIAKGEMDEALKLLKKHTSGKDNDLESQVIMLSGQYAQYKRDERFGLGAKPEVLNRIRFAILTVAGDLPDSSSEGFDNSEKSGPKYVSPGNKMITILFTAANPSDTTPVRLGKESREIETELKLSKHRDRFDFIKSFATRPKDLRRAVQGNSPTIVHFSGHGLKEGIILENDSGNGVFVKPDVLANFFEIFKDTVQCVVLNSCYSKVQAKAINQHIPYVIGMRREMPDKSAIIFSSGFYGALGEGKDYETAFKIGINNIELEGTGGEDIPEMVGFDLGRDDGFSF